MKKVSLILLSASAFIFTNCTQQEIDAPINETCVLNAVMEDVGQTKSDATDEGIFTWSENDTIYVHTTEGFRVGTLIGEGGTASASFGYTLIGEEEETGYAVYPYNESHNITSEAIKVVLPASYELGATLRNTNAIMLASPASDAAVVDESKTNTYRFQHLAGVMRFKFENVPAGVDRFELSLGGAKINGEFVVADAHIATATTEVEAEKATSLTFDALKERSDITLFVPVPVGTYTGANLAFYAGETEIWSYESSKTNTVARKNLVRMPVVKISSSEGTIVTEVGDADALKAAIAAGGEVVLSADIELSEILTVEKNVVLDGNGHKITSSATRAINVSGATDVTIKNLTIEASGERAINVIQNTKKVTIDNVIATAANYTVNVASSAPGAVVNIDNSTLSGLCTVNVSSPSTEVTVENSTINCNDNNTTKGESYAAISLNKEAIGGKIIATNTVVNVTEGSDSYKGRNGAENGEVTINGSTEDVVVMVAAIIYPNSDYYHAFASLDGAIQFDKDNDGVVTLIRDITVDETITIAKDKTVVLDLNGKTISQRKAQSTGYSMISNKGKLTIKNGTLDYGDIAELTSDINYVSNTIWNADGAELTIEPGVTVVNNSNTAVASHGYPHAIDNYGTLTINGGTFTNNANYSSMRIWCTTDDDTKVTINNGNFNGSIDLHNVNNNANKGTLTINGGTFNADSYTKSAVRLLGFGVDVDEIKAYINGGTFNGLIKRNKYAGGEFNNEVFYINGGAFSDISALYYTTSTAKVTVMLSADVTLTEPLIVKGGTDITLDLNGKTISHEFAQTAAYAMITNNGTLTIKDSSKEQNGVISYKDIAVYAADNNWASNTISNSGTLTLESGTIENASSDNVMTYGYPHAIDVYPGSTTKIKGGTVKSANYDCIRMFCNSTTSATSVEISGGNIINRVTFQNPSSNKAGYGVLTITGGTFTTTEKVNANVRLLNFSTDVSKMKASISSGTFDKGVKTQNYASGTTVSLNDWLTVSNIEITEVK